MYGVLGKKTDHYIHILVTCLALLKILFSLMSVVTGSRPDEAAVCQGALQTLSLKGREDWKTGCSATQRAQCREVQDCNA